MDTQFILLLLIVVIVAVIAGNIISSVIQKKSSLNKYFINPNLLPDSGRFTISIRFIDK